jgi:hypothetical protein
MLASTYAFAQQDKCAMVPENMRARCVEAMRVKEKCAGLEGDKLKECQQRSVDYRSTMEDCTKVQGDARMRCEAHNRAAVAAGPCKGKSGAELEQCARDQAGTRAR